MRRLIVSNLMSLDGFFEGQNKNLDWFIRDEEFFDYAREMLRGADMLLFGRATYEVMAAYWPAAPADEIAEKMNGLPKLVASRTLREAKWNHATVIKGNVAEEVTKLKQGPGKDIVLLGSAILASSLLEEGVIDEYRVILTPVLLGNGSPLFKDVRQRVQFKLQATRLMKSGVIVLYYRTA